MNRQKFNLPTGQVKNRYNHKRNEKMESQAEASRHQSSVERLRAQQSSGDSLQSASRAHTALPADYQRGRDVQNTDDQTGSKDCAKRFGFFHVMWRSLLRKVESRKTETIAATMEQLMQICNLRYNGRAAMARPSNLCTLIRKTGTRDRHFVSFPIVLNSRFVVSSWKKCLRPFEF